VAFKAEMETANTVTEICSVRYGEEGIENREEKSFINCLNRVLPQPKKISDKVHELQGFPQVFSKDPSRISDYRKYIFHPLGT